MTESPNSLLVFDTFKAKLFGSSECTPHTRAVVLKVDGAADQLDIEIKSESDG